MTVQANRTPITPGDGTPESSTPDPTGRRTAAVGRKELVLGQLNRFGLPALLVIVFAIFSFVDPEHFFTWHNVTVTLDQRAPIIICALAAMIPLLTGQLDLSVAANMSLGNIVFAVLTANKDWSILPAAVAALALCTFFGLLNGLIVERLQVDSFVATLGMGTVLGGVGLLATNSQDVLQVPVSVTNLSRSVAFFDLRYSVLYALALLLIVGFVLKYLPLGRRLRAVGFNRSAAGLTGIPTGRYLVGSFAVAGLLAGIGGIIITGQLGSATAAGTANGNLLPAFAAVFLGATAFTPGRPNVPGILVAALLLAFLSGGLVLIGAKVWLAPMINGGALIIAVAVSAWATRARARSFRAQQLKALDDKPAVSAG